MVGRGQWADGGRVRMLDLSSGCCGPIVGLILMCTGSLSGQY